MSKDTWAIVKDAMMFFGGMLGLAYQTLTGDVKELLLLVFTVMIGVPGASALLWLRNNGITESLPSSSVPPDSPSDLPNSSKPV